MKVMVFQHEYQIEDKSGQRFIFITWNSVSAVSKLPIYDGNSSEWEEKCVPIKMQVSWGYDDGQHYCDDHMTTTWSSSSSTSPR